MSKQFDEIKKEEALEIQREQQRKQQLKSSATAPQVVAEGWELPVATWFAIDHADGVQFHPSEEQALRYSESGQCVKYFSEDQMRAAWNTRAIAPLVAAGSVDTPEFEKLMVRWSTAGGGKFGLYEQGIPELRTKIVAHINAWAAQHVANAIKDQMERAEKAEAEVAASVAQSGTDFTQMEGVAEQWKTAAAIAEARAAQLSSDLLAAHNDRDAYLSRALEAESRVKDLENNIAERQAFRPFTEVRFGGVQDSLNIIGDSIPTLK